MKKLSLLLLTIYTLSCSAPSLGHLENKSLNSQKDNVSININYPYAVGYPKGEEINSNVEKQLRLSLSLGESSDTASISSIIHSIDTLYTNETFANMRYETNIDWTGYQNNIVLSICTNSFIFPGGAAHPWSVIKTLNFWQESGKLFKAIDVIEDTTYFRKLIIEGYTSQRDLPNNATKEETGLFIELKDLPIAENIQFTDKGLEVVYNQYEIGPYVLGITTLTISYDMVKFKDNLDLNSLKSIGNANK